MEANDSNYPECWQQQSRSDKQQSSSGKQFDYATSKLRTKPAPDLSFEASTLKSSSTSFVSSTRYTSEVSSERYTSDVSSTEYTSDVSSEKYNSELSKARYTDVSAAHFTVGSSSDTFYLRNRHSAEVMNVPFSGARNMYQGVLGKKTSYKFADNPYSYDYRRNDRHVTFPTCTIFSGNNFLANKYLEHIGVRFDNFIPVLNVYRNVNEDFRLEEKLCGRGSSYRRDSDSPPETSTPLKVRLLSSHAGHTDSGYAVNSADVKSKWRRSLVYSSEAHQKDLKASVVLQLAAAPSTVDHSTRFSNSGRGLSLVNMPNYHVDAVNCIYSCSPNRKNKLTSDAKRKDVNFGNLNLKEKIDQTESCTKFNSQSLEQYQLLHPLETADSNLYYDSTGRAEGSAESSAHSDPNGGLPNLLPVQSQADNCATAESYGTSTLEFLNPLYEYFDSANDSAYSVRLSDEFQTTFPLQVCSENSKVSMNDKAVMPSLAVFSDGKMGYCGTKVSPLNGVSVDKHSQCLSQQRNSATDCQLSEKFNEEKQVSESMEQLKPNNRNCKQKQLKKMKGWYKYWLHKYITDHVLQCTDPERVKKVVYEMSEKFKLEVTKELMEVYEQCSAAYLSTDSIASRTSLVRTYKALQTHFKCAIEIENALLKKLLGDQRPAEDVLDNQYFRNLCFELRYPWLLCQ